VSILYTALFGGSDSLKPAPKGPDRCICFADDPCLRGEGWEMVHWPTRHPRHEARVLKISSHLMFPEEKWVVWADASMQVLDWDRLMLDKGNHYVSCIEHWDRNNVYSEAIELLSMESHVDPKSVKRFVAHIRSEGFVSHSLSTTGLLVRRLSQHVIDFNSLWRECLNKYGIDDQLHFDYCLWKVGVKVHYLQGKYTDNPYVKYDHFDHAARRNPPYKKRVR
jgi:hypothetical protein